MEIKAGRIKGLQNAAARLREAGKSANRIAKEMGVHHKTIQRWRNIFEKEGEL